MQAIGERLREARQRMSLDISEVEAATKIRAKYLRALENDDFEQLPGPTFVKTFLRTYAEHLGLDAQLLVEEYRARYEDRDFEVQQLAPQSVPAGRGGGERQRRLPRGPSGPPGPGTAIVVILVALIAIFAILGITGGTGGGSTTTTATQARAPKPVHGGAHRPRPAPPRPTVVVLRVVPAAPTYVCVDHGRGTPPVVNNVIAQPQRFSGRHLRVNAGISSIGLIANGKRVAIPPTNNPVGYDFTPGKVTPIPPGPQRPCLS